MSENSYKVIFSRRVNFLCLGARSALKNVESAVSAASAASGRWVAFVEGTPPGKQSLAG